MGRSFALTFFPLWSIFISSQSITVIGHIDIWWDLITRPRFRDRISKLVWNCIPHLLKVCNLLILFGHLIHVLKRLLMGRSLFTGNSRGITLPGTRITSLTFGQRLPCIIKKRYSGESLFLMRDSRNVVEAISLTRACWSLPWFRNMSHSLADFWPGVISLPPERWLLLTLCRRKLICTLVMLFTVSRSVEISHFVIRLNWKSFLNLAKIIVIFKKLLKLKK